MPNNIKLYKLLLSSPSDIQKESEIIEEEINIWNQTQGDISKAKIEITKWEVNARPEVGDRGQAIINRQIVDNSDIVVGIFWTKFGTPTGIADSGTEEEIRRSIENKKKVLLYFSDNPISPSKINIKEYSKIQEFKKEFRGKSLYWSYKTIDKFKTEFRNHLAGLMNEFRGKDDVMTNQVNQISPNLLISNQLKLLKVGLLHTQVHKEAVIKLAEYVQSKELEDNIYKERLAGWRIDINKTNIENISRGTWDLEALTETHYITFMFGQLVSLLSEKDEYCTLTNMDFWSDDAIGDTSFLDTNKEIVIKGANVKRVFFIDKNEIPDPSFRLKVLKMVQIHKDAVRQVNEIGKGEMVVKFILSDNVKSDIKKWGHFGMGRLKKKIVLLYIQLIRLQVEFLH